MPTRHVLLALAVAVVWGINFVVIDVGLESFPPLLFAALRFAIVAFPAIFFVGRPDVSWKAVAGIGLFTSTGQFALLFVAFDHGLPAGLGSLVLQVQAVFTVLLAVALLDERLTRAQAVGGAVSLAGLALIALGRGGNVPLLALALCVGAAASWAAGNVITRSAKPARPVPLIVWSSLVPPLPLATLSLIFEGGSSWGDAFGGLDLSGVLAVAYIVIVSTFFGYGSWNWLLARHAASKVVPFTLAVPVAGIAAAWLALSEAPTGLELVGAAVILLGLGLTTGALRPRPAPRVVPVAVEG